MVELATSVEAGKRTRVPVDQAFANPLTILGAIVLFAATGAILLAIILTGDATPWLHERPWLVWLVVPPTVAWAPLVMVFCPLFHRAWHVGPTRLRSVQYGKAGSSYTRELPNQGFTQLRTFGPFVLVYQTSGKRLVWPRWLRRERATYVFALRGDSIAVERSPGHLGGDQPARRSGASTQ